MHEMGIALKIIEIASQSIPEACRGIPVEKVNVRVGKLAAVVPESLRFCFHVASRDTPLAGASLDIQEVPVQARCQDCGHAMILDGLPFACEKCEGGRLDFLSGRELTVASLELADEQGD